VIEEIGKYHPTQEPSFIEVDSDRAQYWLGVGAQPTEQVRAILKLTGDWGRFKGDKDAKSTVRTAEAKAEFQVDEAKKSVVKPKAEKPAKTEEPAAEAADETASDEA
jgi:small subunit ribosomal protein S16